jgi:plastocyanin
MGNPLGSMLKAAVVLLVAWGCAPAAALADDHPVGFPTDVLPADYSPPNTEAAVGDTVTFSGAFANHPLVWTNGDFATQSSGTTHTYTFTHPGTFAFHCAIHASMVGSVHVAGPNAFATPDFSWAPASPKTGQTVTFTPGAFTDPDGTITSYEWDLNGDGFFETVGSAPSRTYSVAGSYNVGLRYVDDSHEASPATTHLLTVAQGPTTGGGGGGGTGGGGAGGGTPTPPKPGSPSPGTGGTGGTGGGSTTSPSGGDQGAGTSTTGTTALRVRLGARALTFRSGHASAAVTLNVAATAKATLRLGKTVLATGGATLRSGTHSVRLTISKAGTRALRRAHGSVHATLTVVVRRRAGAKATTARRTLTVKIA